MLNNLLVLFGAIILVFLAAVLFVNAIEWWGCRLRLGSSFVGAILSPLFTSIPELIVLMVAIFVHKGEAGQEIGIGTIFGQPFMASSLSYGLLGIVVLISYLNKHRGTKTMSADKTLAIPYIFVTVLFPLTLLPALWRIDLLKYLLGIVFLGAFIFYCWLMYRRGMGELMESDEELLFTRLIRTESYQGAAGTAQLIVAIGLLYFGAGKLVDSVDNIASGIGLSPLGLALIIVPAATAIPETASALIWGYQGKDTLSIGSLVGEKVLYSTFYPALGLFFTPWALDIHASLSVMATVVISLILLYYILKQKLPWYGLCLGLVFFVAYSLMVFIFRV